MNRRAFARTCGAGLGVLTLPSLLRGADEPAVVKTFTYKTVGKLPIKADVHRADDRKKRPVVVWIHGGALINGHRASVSRRVKDMMLGKGYALVSIDYRLAPETKLPAIISDLEDAFGWLQKKGPELFNVDVSKVAVMGGSAGGYLTLTSGYRAKPRPTVLVPFWGYGDLVGEWYSQPSKHPRHLRTKLSKEEAWKQVSGPPIADSRERKGNGGAFYQYCRQHGVWPQSVSDWDPHKEAKKFYPYMPVKNVTKEYPPTLLIHGTKDTDVPYEQSVLMAEQFKKHGVPYELISIPNGEHGLAGADPKLVRQAYDRAGEFVDKHMKA